MQIAASNRRTRPGETTEVKVGYWWGLVGSPEPIKADQSRSEPIAGALRPILRFRQITLVVSKNFPTVPIATEKCANPLRNDKSAHLCPPATCALLRLPAPTLFDDLQNCKFVRHERYFNDYPTHCPHLPRPAHTHPQISTDPLDLQSVSALSNSVQTGTNRSTKYRWWRWGRWAALSAAGRRKYHRC